MTSIVRRVHFDGQIVEIAARNPNVAASPRLIHTGGAPAKLTSEGTDTTPVVTETYLAEIYVPETVTITGVAIFNGSAVDGNVTIGIYDINGTLVGKSASTAQAGTDAYQRVPLALTLVPGSYWVAVQMDDTDGRLNTHVFGNFGAGKLTGQTYGTMPSGIAVPTTFTTGLGPIASLY